jgi:hypothetical protein
MPQIDETELVLRPELRELAGQAAEIVSAAERAMQQER